MQQCGWGCGHVGKKNAVAKRTVQRVRQHDGVQQVLISGSVEPAVQAYEWTQAVFGDGSPHAHSTPAAASNTLDIGGVEPG